MNGEVPTATNAGQENIKTQQKIPSYSEVVELARERIAAREKQEQQNRSPQPSETEAKEPDSRTSPPRSYEEYVVQYCLQRVPTGDPVKILPRNEAGISYAFENGKPTIFFPKVSEKPLSLDQLVVAFRRCSLDLDGAQLISLRNSMRDMSDAMLMEAQESNNKSLVHAYNKSLELEAIAQEQINKRIPTSSEKADHLPEQVASFEELQQRTISPERARNYEESFKKEIETMPGYKQAQQERAEEVKKVVEKMESEIRQATQPVDFTMQVLMQEAQFFYGDKVKLLTSSEGEVSVTQLADGTMQITVPKQSDLTTVVKLAREFASLRGGTDPSRIEAFAIQLQETARLMVQQGGFSEEAILSVYHRGQQLQALLHPEDRSLAQPKAVEQIREESKQAMTSEQVRKIATEMLLGKGVIIVGEDGKMQQSAYDRLFNRWKTSHPKGTEDQFEKEYLEPRNYRIDFLRPYIEASVQEGGKAYKAAGQVAEQRAHETITQAQLDEWVDAVQNFHTSEAFNQKWQEALVKEAISKKEGEALTTEERLQVITRLLQSGEIVDKLQYLPADIREALKQDPETANKYLVAMACNLKSAELLKIAESDPEMQENVGVIEEGNHVWVVIKIGEEYIEIDASTPEQMARKGITEHLSGMTKIAKEDTARIERAQKAIANRQNNKQIIVATMYTNAAAMAENPDVQRALLLKAVMADPNNAMAWFGLGEEAKAKALDSDIEVKFKATEGKIGVWNNPRGIPITELYLRGVLGRINTELGGKTDLSDLTSAQIQNYLTHVQEYEVRMTTTIDPNDPTGKTFMYNATNTGEAGELINDLQQALVVSLQKEGVSQEKALYRREGITDETEMKRLNEIKEIIKVRNSWNGTPPPPTFGTPARTLTAVWTDAVEDMKRYMANKSHMLNNFPETYTQIACESEELQEDLLIRILYDPFQSEVAQYQINDFFTSPRIDALKVAFKTSADRYEQWASVNGGNSTALGREYLKRATLCRDRFREYTDLKSSLPLFHAMNSAVVTGSIEGLTKSSPALNQKQFEIISKVHGYGEAMSLYEQEFLDMRAKKPLLSVTDIEVINESVKNKLIELSKKGIIKSKFAEFRDAAEYQARTGGNEVTTMEEDEAKAAAFTGRTLFNIFLRSGNHIALTMTPGDPASMPQGKIAASLDKFGNEVKRWEAGGQHGGKIAVRHLQAAWYRISKRNGFNMGRCDVYQFGGGITDKIRMAEFPMASDFWNGYRGQRLAFPAIYTRVPNPDPNKQGQFLNLNEYLDQPYTTGNSEKLSEALDRLYKEAATARKKKDSATELRIGAEITTKLKHLVDNTDMGLGILLVRNQFWGDHPRYGYDGRVELWRKVAKTNHLQTANNLRGLKGYARDADGMVILDKDDNPTQRIQLRGQDASGREGEILSLEQILYNRNNAHGTRDPITGDVTLNPIGEAYLKKLQDKMTVYRKKVEVEARRRNPNNSLVPPVTIKPSDIYDAKEQAIVADIQLNGERLAEHLADMQWNSPPFLDIPFEDIDYSNLNSNEFERKMGDVAQQIQIGDAIYGWARNPGGTNQEKLWEILEKMKPVWELTESGRIAVKKTGAIYTADAELGAVYEGDSWGPWQHVKSKILRMPTSEKQRMAGTDAEADNEPLRAERIRAARLAGWIDEEEERELKKALGATWVNILLAYLRDVGVFAPILIGKELLGEVMERAA